MTKYVEKDELIGQCEWLDSLLDEVRAGNIDVVVESIKAAIKLTDSRIIAIEMNEECQRCWHKKQEHLQNTGCRYAYCECQSFMGIQSTGTTLKI